MDVFIARPFEGIAGEAELVAMVELLASATCTLSLRPHPALTGVSTATFVTILPGGCAGLRTDAGGILVGLQTAVHSSDRSADFAQAIITAASAPVGEFVAATAASARDVRLQDLLADGALVTSALHDDFAWWRDLGVVGDEDAESVRDMDESFSAATRVGPAAFFVPFAERTQVRMVLPDAESVATDAFARLLAGGEEGMGEESRWLGNFRTCGLLAPVWDVAHEATAEQMSHAVAAFLQRYQAAAADPSALSGAQRQARATVVGKHVTVR